MIPKQAIEKAISGGYRTSFATTKIALSKKFIAWFASYENIALNMEMEV
jgi:hypothetical protein